MYAAAKALLFLLVQKGNPKSTLKSTCGSLDNFSLVADAHQFGDIQVKTKSLTYIFILKCSFDSLRRLLGRISCKLIGVNLNLKPHEAENKNKAKRIFLRCKICRCIVASYSAKQTTEHHSRVCQVKAMLEMGAPFG